MRASWMIALITVCTGCCTAFAEEAAAAPDPAAVERFEKDVRPILVNRCQGCHGAEKQKGQLRLDSRAAMQHGGEAGAVVVPGDAAKSILVQALSYTGELRMPPDAKLPQAEIDTLTKWVAEGAVWPDYGNTPAPAASAPAKAGVDYEKGRQWWAFKPVAAQTPPAVQDSAWPQTPVDNFLLARLETEGLPHAAPADKRTLLRRVTFDLTGLPPTPEDVDAFIADTAPDAYAKVVERLLASPRYGERWARHWLDVVRYTDSFDSRASAAQDPTQIYKYRDWVISAFNNDMPYDRFLKYQIAGDIIAGQQPQFNPEGIIATGALAIGNWPQGDADKQKMVSDIVDDQIDLVCRGFMGVTMGCARCHDHKFDPFATRDYYGLAGMFFSSHILPGPGQKTEGSPILFIPLMGQAELDAINQRKARIEELDKQVNATLEARRKAFTVARLDQTAKYMLAARDFAAAPAPKDPAQFAMAQGLDTETLNNWINYLGLGEFKLMKRFTAGVGGVPALASLNGPADTPSFTVNNSGEPAKFLNITFPPRSIALHPGPTTPVAVAWRSPFAGIVTMSLSVADLDSSCGDGADWRIDKKNTGAQQIAEGGFNNGGKDDDLKESQPVAVANGDYLMLYITPKTSHICDTTLVKWTITEQDGEHRVWDLTEDVLRQPLSEGSNPLADARGVPGVWQFVDVADAAAPTADSPLAPWQAAMMQNDRAALEAAAKGVQETAIAQAAALSTTPPADPKTVPLAAEFLSNKGPFFTANPPYVPETPGAADPLPGVQKELADLRAIPTPEVPVANGIQEGGVPNTEHAGVANVRIHQRGDYNRLGDEVSREMPIVLASEQQQPVTEGSGRLDLANFVASGANPLTARVMANRIWQHHFGEGLVRTPGNFGARGETPSHPELLDYLADQFVKSGWSIKAMHRLMVLSAAYQQASTPSREALAKDPENKLLSHAPRMRLEAEALRDAMLAVAGKLDTTMGGEAFKEQDTPRRTIYYRTVRSDRTTYNMLFDAADPASIVDKRNIAIVAPQALFLMNNPFVLAQAKALAARVPATVPVDAAVDQLYPLLFARPARDAERAIAGELVAQFVSEGQPAEQAWASYCQTLLATNEFMYLD